jgi:peptide/nickel transport system ATP-binding protein
MSDVLVIKNLKKYFDVRSGVLSIRAPPVYVKAVDDLSFTIGEGKIFGLVGESGCGKTTTGRLIARLETPTSGSIVFRDRDVAKLDKKQLRHFRKNLQMIFQDPYESLNPRFTVMQTVSDPLTVYARDQSMGERLEAVTKALDDAGLKNPEEMLDRYPHELSGGQRQRVAIARALVVGPQFMVADEPVSMLDVSIRVGVMNLMLDIKERLKIAYLFVTHDVAIARYMSDQLGVMYLGEIVEMAETDELIHNPAHPYTKALLAAVPIPDPDYVWEDVPIRGEIPSPINLPPGCRFHPRCVWAKDICSQKSPEMVEVKDGHFVKCFFAEEIYANPDMPVPELEHALESSPSVGQPEVVSEEGQDG